MPKPPKKLFAQRIAERMQALGVSKVDDLVPMLLDDNEKTWKALNILVTQAQLRHAPDLIAFLYRTEDITQIHDAGEAIIKLQQRQVNLLQPLIDYMLNFNFGSQQRETVAHSLTHEYPKLPRTWHERLSRAFCTVLVDMTEVPNLRGQAAEGLAELYDCYFVGQYGRTRQYRRAGGLLIRMLCDPTPEVRFWSCFALGMMCYRPALPALNALANKDLANHSNWWSVGEEASDAIDWIKGRTPPERVARGVL